ncbi:histone-lysine N-methyltransferase SUVR4 [Sorghum bicolor]|uniref:SET domain-containing protein n=1 Tax=Sorghum bicolor TaxID=4558 RepID=A0A194YR25_SORBI|nr:histone-lysine N-methyltransferase SUVR4 [Sorghum bicolor]KXG30647.1 hypothetical protein SORBI_3004G218000 [Sorghum bicolor]|eukprot:XP_021314313.1 histone-lysine N-methyltransferase SUVR4 [Sorghum bicolor]
MELSKTSMEKIDDAIKSTADFGFSKETVLRVLKKLLKVYDGNWEHIEADNYSVLADAILSDSDPEEGQKKRAEKKNLDSDHHRKKLKTKEHGRKAKSCTHGSVKRELAEVPRQQEAESLEGRTNANQLLESSPTIISKEQKMKISRAETTRIGENGSTLLESQDPCTFETPLAVICPEVLEPSCHNGHQDAHMISGVKHPTDKKFKGILVAHEGHMVDACSSQAIVSSKDFSTNFQVELSNYGKGKLSFLFNPSLANGSDFQMPGIQSICKAMEAKCLRTYKILEPNFSFMKLLDDTCQCILDLGSGPNGGSADSGGNQNNPSNMRVIQHLPTGIKRQYHDVNDITRGEECLSIPIVSGEDGVLPPPFYYISQNITFQDAYINLSLARIGDENCCSGCFGDCLAEPLPCACARETGGEFAYTRDGLLKEGFLDACVSMLREPLEQSYFYCNGVCPIEQMKGVNKPEACKGHRIKKFIKECWRKCGCTRNCGNRVVQRGITRKLQVFLTPGKKGWGLRSAENLPRGAFVCEYVGEILTNTELYERNTELSGKNNQRTGKVKHTYPVLLDSDWGTEGVLKDEEALCLDGTFYGNVARFINHRCFDCNIIAIPVEIETPDHHYYHLAFFTTREVKPFEELTWDYEIDFDDVNHPIKAFKCHCGSAFCRDRRRMSSVRRRI